MYSYYFAAVYSGGEKGDMVVGERGMLIVSHLQL